MYAFSGSRSGVVTRISVAGTGRPNRAFGALPSLTETPMSETLTPTERLNLFYQLRILRALEPNERKYDELEEIVCSGYEVFYGSITDVIEKPMPADEGSWVLDVLTMFEMLGVYVRDNPTDAEVAGHPWAKFRGFNRNRETALYGFTRFVIETQGKFEGVAESGLDSPHATREIYDAMLDAWKSDKGSAVFGEALTHETAMEILNAAKG